MQGKTLLLQWQQTADSAWSDRWECPLLPHQPAGECPGQGLSPLPAAGKLSVLHVRYTGIVTIVLLQKTCGSIVI